MGVVVGCPPQMEVGNDSCPHHMEMDVVVGCTPQMEMGFVVGCTLQMESGNDSFPSQIESDTDSFPISDGGRRCRRLPASDEILHQQLPASD